MEQELDPEVTAPIPTPIEEEEETIKAEDMLSHEQRFQRWQSKRPPIDHLRDGVFHNSDGTSLPLFDVGDRIVVDVRTTLLRGVPWLQTLVGKVRTIDDESGLVTLWDEDADPRNPPCRYVNFKDTLHIFKLAPDKGNPFEPPPAPKPEKPQPVSGKKGRGRPKGSKNRPKDVIKAEREARKAAKGKAS